VRSATARTGQDPYGDHRRKVEEIIRQLRAHSGDRPVSLRKKAVSHQVPKAGDLKYSDHLIDIRALDAILEIDPQRRICVAESGVTFVDLVAATLRHGLVPTVVPELKTVTVGGAVAGCSIESMSFQYGGFHDSCLELEIITATGEVLTCTRDGDQRLLFEMIHGTFGTLGILSCLTFRLVPAAPFVRVCYERHARLPDYQAAIAGHLERRDLDFMDGIIHAPDEHILSTGHFVESAPYTNRYDWLKVYHQSTRTRREDYLRTEDYFFRYDRGVTNVHPRSLVGRLLLGKFLGSTEVLRLAEKVNPFLPARSPTVIVDVFIPSDRVDAFMAWYRQEIGHFPLWVVPYQRVHHYPWLAPQFYARSPGRLFLDLAIYGLKQPAGKNYHALIEQKLLELGGLKTLISHNYYSEEDFWKTFDRDNYTRAKARTDPRNIFRDFYTKTCRAARGLADQGERPPPRLHPSSRR
jgi:FAD/FMN-containing dehydrogenase